MAVSIKKPELNARPTRDILFGEGYEVVCPNCRDVFHETTEFFTEEKPANGTMFRLLRPFGPLGANWSSFPNDADVVCEALECPGCGCSYTGGGTRVKVRKKRASIVENDIVRREAFVERVTDGGKLSAEEIFSEANAAAVIAASKELAPTDAEQDQVDEALIASLNDTSNLPEELKLPEDDLPDPEKDDSGDDCELEDGACCDQEETKPE
jgi:hypothetical protein